MSTATAPTEATPTTEDARHGRNAAPAATPREAETVIRGEAGAATPGDAERRSERRRWIALAVLCLGQLMMVLDATRS